MMIPWYGFALLSAVLAGFAAIITKKTLGKEHAMEFAATLAIINALITAPFLFVVDFSAWSTSIFLLLIFVSFCAALAFLLMTKAVRHLPLSISSPLLILGPAFTAFLAFFFLEEALDVVDIAGLALVLFGVFIIKHEHGVSILNNLSIMLKEKFTKYIFASLLFYSICALIERQLLRPIEQGGLALGPMDVLAFTQALIAVIFFVLLYFFHDGIKDIKRVFSDAWKPIIIIAILTVGYRYAQSVAATSTQGYIALVEAIKRSSALIAIVIGGEIFHEENILQKTFAALIIISGVLLIIV